MSQTCTVRSALAEARSVPSGDQATERTLSVWPEYVSMEFPVMASHTCAVLSKEPETIDLPSGDQATVSTSAV